MRLKQLFTLAFVVALATTMMPSPAQADTDTPAQAAAAPNSWYRIYPVSFNYNLCAEVQGGSTANSAVVQQFTCGLGLHMAWQFRYLDNGYYRLVNVKSGKCMNVQGGGSANGTAIIQFTCGGASAYNDQWRMVYLITFWGHDYYHIINRQTGKCLNLRGGSSSPGADIIQWTCSDTALNDDFTWQIPAGWE
ncbi:RICIN domain-containing protein [Actinoplanes rectilineatus]|uniref:RICIN domain-containing protein n=1 Tax=Actinoplanes rectilineatus TaxID=113571 RepID=UPI0005F2AD7B|nr:RICIN domain-containing protein [Actinoplanes rectilineatus]